ncbi:MAG: hypothetical protein ACR2PK_17335 [Acidimicrobiales bacterium]
MRKLVASTTIAASVLGGGAAALTLAPTGASAQDSDAPTETAPATQSAPADTTAGSRLSDVLDSLVEDGTLDQDQRDAVETALREARPDREAIHRHSHRGPGRILNGAVLEDLGLEPQDVREGLMNGQTLGEIAEANGSSADALIDAVTTQLDDRLENAVASGRIDEAEADERRSEMESRIEELVNQQFERFNRDPGRFGADSEGDDDTGA